MRKSLLLFLFFTFNSTHFTIIQVQNLLPNFSFEQYDTYPNLEDQIQYATGWSIYSIESPDQSINSTPSTTNIFVGVGAGNKNTTGTENTCVGSQAGFSNAIESNETFIGYQAGYSTHPGPGNTFVGAQAGYSNTTGVDNVFMEVRAVFLKKC